jgi:hypothetical protein
VDYAITVTKEELLGMGMGRSLRDVALDRWEGAGEAFCVAGEKTKHSTKRQDLVSQLLSEDLPILELENVDEDAQGPDATMKDEVILLARGNEMWAGELVKYLQAGRKERGEMQEQRAGRRTGCRMLRFLNWYFHSFITSRRQFL